MPMNVLAACRPRKLLPVAIGLVLFLAWFGFWVRVLPARPRLIIHTPENALLIGLDRDRNALLTKTVFLAENAVRFWDLDTGEELPGEPAAVVRGATGNHFLYQIQRLPQLHALLSESGAEASISIAPNKKTLAWVSKDGLLQIWDVQADRAAYVIGDHAGGPVTFNPDSQSLTYVRNRDRLKELVQLDVRTWKETRTYQLRCDYLSNLCCSPDGLLLAVHHWKNVPPWAPRNSITVWSTVDGKELATIEGNNPFAFAPDGKHLVSSHLSEAEGAHLKVWRVRDWSERETLRFSSRGHRGNALLTPLPNTRWLRLEWWVARQDSSQATSAPDRVSLFRDESRGRAHCLTRFVDASSGVLSDTIIEPGLPGCSAFSEDGKLFAYQPGLGRLGEIHVYDVPPDRPMGIYLLLSLAPTAILTAGLWWWLRR
jgi:WD40 repeat protein